MRSQLKNKQWKNVFPPWDLDHGPQEPIANVLPMSYADPLGLKWTIFFAGSGQWICCSPLWRVSSRTWICSGFSVHDFWSFTNDFQWWRATYWATSTFNSFMLSLQFLCIPQHGCGSYMSMVSRGDERFRNGPILDLQGISYIPV